MCEELSMDIPAHIQKQIFAMCTKSAKHSKQAAPTTLSVGQFAELLVRFGHYLTEANRKLKQAGKIMTAEETELVPYLRSLLRSRFLSWSRLNTADNFRSEIFHSPQVEAALTLLKRVTNMLKTLCLASVAWPLFCLSW